ncbi:MAG: twin-arginine translocase TatA/TatE family subunit [Dehalococcoidia bacterium]|nr:twin-arginine translocase TatA/TatE family subunit [Dehalococcoidia bacterium]MXY20654.1 twin-arginine translocase TatA/TatE family subunit [Dehalococcoidia bacterium]
MPSLGPMELIIILVIVMLIFGVGKLSDIGGALGKSVREFRKSTIEDDAQEKASASKDNKERETTT